MTRETSRPICSESRDRGTEILEVEGEFLEEGVALLRSRLIPTSLGHASLRNESIDNDRLRNCQ